MLFLLAILELASILQLTDQRHVLASSLTLLKSHTEQINNDI